MAKICPKCSADTEPLEEETQRFCIHEKIGITLIGAAVIVAGLIGTGVI
ncbi:MAG: hypothetical protein ABEJ07_06260 [Candidatus Nanohaloarchaea archaeon]